MFLHKTLQFNALKVCANGVDVVFSSCGSNWIVQMFVYRLFALIALDYSLLLQYLLICRTLYKM